MNLLNTYTPPGPVAAAYILSDARVCGILGPIGSGKTSASFRKILVKAAKQAPSPVDGVRRYRVGVFRNTYRELTSTTMRSWFDLVPQTTGTWRGEDHTHMLRFDSPRMDVEFVFMALDRPEDAGKLKGLELSDGYINEGVEMQHDSVMAIEGRIDRYPPVRHGGCVAAQLIMDTNAPDTESWWYRLFEEEKTKGWALFKQPGGLDPGAENLENLPGGAEYYRSKLPGKAQWWIDVMIHAKYAYSQRGKPIFGAEFNHRLHVASRDLDPIKGRRLIIGMDTDLHPAASFWQRSASGQWRGLDELYRPGFGPKRFADELRRVIDAEFKGLEVIGIADPAGGTGADKADPNDLTWIQSVAQHAGIKIQPAPTNKLHPRLEAWRLPLSRMIDGEPGMILSPRMRMTIKGLAAGYRFSAIIRPGGATDYTGTPEKNEYSHPIDAGGYALLTEGGHAEIMGKAIPDRPEQPRDRRRIEQPYNPFSF